MAMVSTSYEHLDLTLNRLQQSKAAWAACDTARRIEYLRRCRAGIMAVRHRWVQAGCRAKQIETTDNQAGEEWFLGPALVVRCLRLLEEALEAGGRPAVKVRPGPDGRAIAHIWPLDLKERLLWLGFRGELWLTSPNQGTLDHPPRVGMVLGAGNVGAIGATDVLYKLFVENQVVVLKMNPVNEYLGPLLEEAFAALVEDGFFAVVYGGAEVGARLVEHPAVEAVHLTGSDKTHDAIVWGTNAEEVVQRKRARNPRLSKAVSSELGCATPVLVVPGPWSEADLNFQANHMAGMKLFNGGFNCVAAQLMVTSREWPLREKFLLQVTEALRAAPSRHAYYPGAAQRVEAFKQAYPDAVQAGDTVVATGLDESQAAYACKNELFSAALAEVALPASDPEEFLRQAVRFANEKAWGTLSCTLLVHPITLANHRKAIERAVRDLRYGSVGVNVFTGAIFGLMVPAWGAFPGHTLEDIGSGRGFVHNTMLFDHPEKSVVWAPFRIFPTPVWFVDRKNAVKLGERFTDFQNSPSWWNFLRVLMAAL